MSYPTRPTRPNPLLTSLSLYFGDRLPAQLDRDADSFIKKRLRSRRLFDDYHVDEVRSMALLNAISYLDAHGGGSIRQPRAWFFTLCHHAFLEYVKQVTANRTNTLSSALEGDVELLDEATLTDASTQKLFREGYKQLRPRHQQFVRLDLVERQPPAVIQQTMNLPGDGAFRKLKHEAFKALREAIVLLIEKGVGGLF